MPNDQCYPAEAEFFGNTNAFKLYDIDVPMKIPTLDYFPTVFVLRAENMTDELLTELVNKLGNDKPYWIQQAKRYKQDLILFYH